MFVTFCCELLLTVSGLFQNPQEYFQVFLHNHDPFEMERAYLCIFPILEAVLAATDFYFTLFITVFAAPRMI